jgi:hypothetical protein
MGSRKGAFLFWKCGRGFFGSTARILGQTLS